MTPTAATSTYAKSDARMLDRAEGVLMAIRRCTIDAAFHEIVEAAKRHGVPPLSIARALVGLTMNSASDDAAVAAARNEWGSLLGR